jgi:hypothetical protein
MLVLAGGTVDLFEFRAFDGILLDFTLRPHLTHMSEVLKQNGAPRLSQFMTEKSKKTARSSQKKDCWILNLHPKENPPFYARGGYIDFLSPFSSVLGKEWVL